MENIINDDLVDEKVYLWLNDQVVVSCLMQEDMLHSEMEGDWDELLKESDGKKVYLFGAGKMTRQYIDRIKKKVKIEYIIDNDSKRNGENLSGCIICTPDKLFQEKNGDCIVIIASTIYATTIYKQLVNNGITRIYSLLNLLKKEEDFRVKIDKCREYLKNIPINRNKILVKLKPKGRYAGNAKIIVEELVKINPNCEIVWMSELGEKVPKYIKKVASSQQNLLYELASASVFIYNDIQHFGIPKKDGQLFINTWHGCVALKHIGKYINNASVDVGLELMHINGTSEKTDYYISNGTWCTGMYRDSFNYSGEILEVGSPRLDPLFENKSDDEKTIRSELGIANNKRILLYAPTFRQCSRTNGSEVIEFNILNMKSALEERFGGEWEIVVKMHPAVKLSETVKRRLKNAIWIETEKDIYEILKITEVLMTDYSSTMFEVGFLKRKVILFATDVETYLKYERGMYFDFFNLPYPIALSEGELLEVIRNFDENKYLRDVEKFNKDELGIVEDGTAGRKVAQIINLYIKGE